MSASRSAAAKKAWITRRGASGGALSAAAARGAIVNRGLLDHILGMKKRGMSVGSRIRRMPIQGFPKQSPSAQQQMRQRVMRHRRIGNVNAIRVARGQNALVFKNQGKAERWPRRFR